ncbi:hypothetical protein DAEQUDRAFT_732699 [Daedalea quercina L-15889]|uniref:Uncharacterized protein n=1 Tax=Daedalea quercina L-15889 TaxID=1314783 RepID=A0A165LGN8_9APHY|nr:hypothetical protein DAEQUDRAFT_732699 [Daedalea quercina L-15889]
MHKAQQPQTPSAGLLPPRLLSLSRSLTRPTRFSAAALAHPPADPSPFSSGAHHALRRHGLHSSSLLPSEATLPFPPLAYPHRPLRYLQARLLGILTPALHPHLRPWPSVPKHGSRPPSVLLRA